MYMSKEETKIETHATTRRRATRGGGKRKELSPLVSLLAAPGVTSTHLHSLPISLFSLSLFLSRFPLCAKHFPNRSHPQPIQLRPSAPGAFPFLLFWFFFFPAFWSFSFFCRSCSSCPETRDARPAAAAAAISHQPSTIAHQSALHRRLRPGVVSAGAGGTAAAGSTPVTGSLGSTGGNPSHSSFSHGRPTQFVHLVRPPRH